MSPARDQRKEVLRSGGNAPAAPFDGVDVLMRARGD